MAGHIQWSKVKHIQGALDTNRRILYSRFSRGLTAAAREGGGNVASNPLLRLNSAKRGQTARDLRTIFKKNNRSLSFPFEKNSELPIGHDSIDDGHLLDPASTSAGDAEASTQVLRLDGHGDSQSVDSNFDTPDVVMAAAKLRFLP